MLNYANLNDVEFEYLCQDIMQKKLNVELRRFARGKDGGIDLADDVHTKNIIVQVKHYMASSVSQLISTLKDEVEKVAKISPKEYYICCSKELSPQKVNEIYQLFSSYMSSTSNIITLNEIDDFLNDPVNIEILKKHYKLWIESTGILNQYEASLSRLLDGFVQLVSENGTKKLAMVNPSVNDYIDGRLIASTLEREQLISRVFSIQQKKRLLTEIEFDLFAQSTLNNHEIERYMFDNESQKNAFIAFYVCKYKILDGAYTAYIQSFLNAPCNLQIYGNESIASIEIIRVIFQKDICSYYNIEDFMNNKCRLDDMLNAFVFEEMVEVICLINKFFNGECRDVFVETASEQLGDSIQSYCWDLDVDDFDPDVDHAIEMSRYFNGEYEDIDTTKAASYIEDDVISDVEDEIDSQLAMLPEDIEQHKNYTKHLTYSIYGAEDLINSHLEYDGYDYDDYRETRGCENPNLEIEYIFDRD